MIVVRELTSSLPELDEARWRGFAGEDPEGRLLTRAILLAHADSLTNPFVIASAWDAAERSLRGIAIAMREEHSAGRSVWSVLVPGAHQRHHCPGIWITAGEDSVEVTARLLAALAAHARESATERLIVALCPEDDAPTRAAVERLGGRSFPALSDHRVALAPGATLERYLAGLSRQDRWKLRRDLRRPAEIGASISDERPPSAATVEAIWPLMRDTFLRKRSRFRFRSNLAAALVERAGNAVGVALCHRGDERLGFVLHLRAGDTAQLNYFGRVAEPPLHLESVLLEHLIVGAIEQGIRTVILGMTTDVLKRRLGSTPLPQVHYHVPVDAML